MAMVTHASIADYIAAQPKAVQGALKSVRSAIRKAIPQAEESLSYKIPTYKIDGRVVIYFAGWAKHYALYPSGPKAIEKFKKQLAPYEVSKGTIRFPLSEEVPVKLIAAIAKFRAREAAARTKAARSGR
jgi:uncharacterized protein YdhG (YjbR/CyaY superfamily)